MTESQRRPQPAMLGLGIAQAPVHVDIPDAGIEAVEAASYNECRLPPRRVVPTIERQAHIHHNGADVLPEIEHVWEQLRFCGPPADYTLLCTPDRRNSGEEAKNFAVG